MTMADNVIRKACDRCHTQKLSCKRVADEACERCVRLKAECKSSPSLRYKKQHQQQQQQQQQQQHQSQQQRQNQVQPHLPQAQHQQHQQQQRPHPQTHINSSSELDSGGRRSPKRRRTDSDPNLVQPETAVPIVGQPAGGPTSTTTESHTVAVVTPGPVLGLGDFDFDFDFFTHPPPHPEHLTHQGVPNGVVVDPHTFDNRGLSLPDSCSWDQQQQQQLPPPPSSDHQHHHHHHHQYIEVAPNQIPGITSTNNSPHRIIPTLIQNDTGCAPSHNSNNTSVKPPRQRHRPKRRQIILRETDPRVTQPPPTTNTTNLFSGDLPLIHWMAQLSDINARLLDLASALPQPKDVTQQNGQPLGRPTDERFRAHGFPIDEMFKLTRCVADILDQHSTVTNGDKNGSKTRVTSLDGSDPGNSMLVLSTYVRLLDMYQRVFTLVRTEVLTHESNATFRFWKLPDVTVGSFTVESAPSLQMSLTIQLAEEFLSRLRNCTAALKGFHSGGQDGQAASRGSSGDSTMFSGVVDASFKALQGREESLVQFLAAMRNEIEAMLDS